jgi:HD-GYP domain-containing protein (c-di-GMP phosphodiesterase class II)
MANCVTVDIRQIIDGRQLAFPIHDLRGVLLLAAGTVFTEDHRRRLVARRVTRVVMNADDAAKSTVPAGDDDTEQELMRLDKKLTDRLDSLIRSGMLSGRNSGPAVLNNLVRHGTKPCDPERMKQLVARHAAASAKLDALMKADVAAEKPDGNQIGGVADACVESLIADIDSALRMTGLKNVDPTLAEHALNVSLLGIAIGIDMGLDAANVRTVGICGLVQDLGMAKVPEHIRNARRRLSPSEAVDIQRHAIHTANILEHVKGIPPLVQLVAYQVHERPDGSGYPRGREKMCIHPFARILHVADAYLAMTAQRPFRPPLMPYAAMECLVRQAEKNQVDADVVRSLLRVLSLFPIGSFVRLSDGRVAQVVRSNAHSFVRPIVAIVEDSSGSAVNAGDEAALVNLSGSELSVREALPTPGSNQIPLSPEIADWSIRIARFLPEEERRRLAAQPAISRLQPAAS